jgi:DNA-binding winged helix-turn-helix (wHTH) protein
MRFDLLSVFGLDTRAIGILKRKCGENLRPKHLAERLYRYFHHHNEMQQVTTNKDTPLVVREASGHIQGDHRAPSPFIGDTFPRPLDDIMRDKNLLATLHARLADTEDLQELITFPPVIFIDDRQKLFFYRGLPVKLSPAYLNYLIILARRPKEIVTRQEIYDQLWPGEINYEGTNKPYERQISDHKRKIIAQIRKGIAGKATLGVGELQTLIFTRPKVGYMLNVGKEDVVILPSP